VPGGVNNIGCRLVDAPLDQGFIEFPDGVQSGYYLVMYSLRCGPGGTGSAHGEWTDAYNCTLAVDFGWVEQEDNYLYGAAIFRIDAGGARVAVDNFVSPGGEVSFASGVPALVITQINPQTISKYIRNI